MDVENDEYKNISIDVYFHSSDSDTSDTEPEYESKGFEELLEEVSDQSLKDKLSEVFRDSECALEEARERLKEVKLENRELKHKLAKVEFVLFTTKEKFNFELEMAKERIESLRSAYAKGSEQSARTANIIPCSTPSRLTEI